MEESRKNTGILNFGFGFRSQDSATSLVITLLGAGCKSTSGSNTGNDIVFIIHTFSSVSNDISLASSSASSPQSAIYWVIFQFTMSLLILAVPPWLRCCATNRKVAGSIPAGVSGFLIHIKSFRSHYWPWGRISL